jgi:uncharacterized protein YuzE
MPIRKIKAGLVLTKDVDEFVGEPGYLFYDESPNGDKTLRISDGVTPGGVTFLNALGSASGDSTVTNLLYSQDSTAVQIQDNFVPTEDNVYSLGTPDKRFSEIHVSQGSIFLGDLVIRDSGSGSMQIFQADGVTPAKLDGPLHQLTLVGDDSTGTTFDLNNTVKFQGTGGITVSVSGDAVTIDGSGVAGGGGSSTLTVSDDASTTVDITTGQDTLKFAGGNNITTALSGDTLTIDGPNTGFTFVGDDSTGTAFDTTQSPNIRFLGAGNVTVAVSGSNVIITGSGAGGSATYTQDTAPSSPTDGETWFDTDSGALYIWVEESGNGQWIETGSAGSTLDAESVTSFRFGDDDTDTTTVSQGETLSILGGQGIATDITGDGEITISSTGATVVTDDTAPTSPVDGDLWYDTDSGSFYVNVVESGSANWIEVGSSGSGGNQIYTQDDSPSTPTDGDLWWDTDAGALYIYVVESGVGNWIETAGSGQAGGGGITSLAADSTPELGGNLDANAYNINNLGTISVATNGDPGTDPATDSGVGYIYAKGATAELFVKDGAGNITQISPHNDEGEWVYYSENVKTGKRVKVNMEKMIRRLEEITGETFFEIDDPHKINY